MARPTENKGLLFVGVVAFLLALVGWWIYFLVNESYSLDRATGLLQEGRTDAVLRELGARDGAGFTRKARQFRVMFVAEGIVMGLLLLTGVFLLYRALLRESRLRTDQERFLTGATHRLKTPLATVRLGIESMLAGTMPEEKREHYLNSMLREVERLEGDVANVLAAGGLDSASGLELTPGDLAEDVREASDMMRDRFDAADIVLDVDIEDGVCIRRNSGAMRLVLHNLLENAVKYSSAGSRVHLSLARDGDQARLTVRDSGRGISEAEMPRIFDRFFSGTAKGHKGGSGIGLYLVRKLVETHHGRVEARSDGPDQGAEFTIRVPLVGGAS